MYGSFYELGVPFVHILRIKALLFGVYIGAPAVGNSHMVSVLGIGSMAWGIYLMFGYLDQH